MFAISDSSFWMRSYFKDSPTADLFVIEDNYGDWYWNDNDLDRLRNLFFKRLKRNPRYFAQLKKMWKTRLKKFDAVISKVQKTDLSELSDQALLDLYAKFYNAYSEEYTVFMALGDGVSMRADSYLVPIFEKLLGSDFKDIFPVLVSTPHKSFIEREELDRQKLVKQFRASGKVSKGVLAAHSAKYFYINNNYAKGDYLSSDYFLSLIKAEARKKPAIPAKVARSRSRTALIKKYKISPWQETLLNVTSEFFGLQDTRKKYVLISNHYQFRFLQEASRRTGIPFDLLKFSVFPEFAAVLDKSIGILELKKRQKLCICIQTRDEYYIETGKTARELKNFFAAKLDANKELSGMVASPGKARGRVTIVLKTHDIVKMKQGDILVSSMTRPEMIPAMKKAAAIVTDEGGITSHAAIVSREMGIPCILGTKTATKVLIDGMIVEVDADLGKIKIL